MLPNGAIVREVLDTVRPHLRSGAIIVKMNSSDPIGTRDCQESLQGNGR
jgi:3-hydroxyisobutyrate dehydrogenase-like beta-hydroxyacid dehydrogenase